MKNQLTVIPSLHEQREYQDSSLPFEGDWVEFGEFVPIVEQFQMKERWECIKREETKNGLRLHMKKLDIEADDRAKHELVKGILDSQGKRLQLQFLGGYIRGCFRNKEHIHRKLKAKFNLDFQDKDKRLLAMKLLAAKIYASKKDKILKNTKQALEAVEKERIELEKEWREKYGDEAISEGHREDIPRGGRVQ